MLTETTSAVELIWIILSIVALPCSAFALWFFWDKRQEVLSYPNVNKDYIIIANGKVVRHALLTWLQVGALIAGIISAILPQPNPTQSVTPAGVIILIAVIQMQIILAIVALLEVVIIESVSERRKES